MIVKKQVFSPKVRETSVCIVYNCHALIDLDIMCYLVFVTVDIEITIFPTCQIHPIFMLSIADCLLAVLWTVGGSLWLYNGVTTSEESERVGCFTVLLMTVVSLH